MIDSDGGSEAHSLLDSLDPLEADIDIGGMEPSAHVSDDLDDTPKPQALFSLRSIAVIAVGLTGSVEYSMLMPSLNAYVQELGESQFFYGLAMGIFSAARLIVRPMLGIWSDRRPMIEPFVFSVVLGTVEKEQRHSLPKL